MLYDTKSQEVFTVVRIKPTHNFMNEPLSIMTGRDAKVETFKTKEGGVNLHFMLYINGRATVRRVDLPAGLIKSLKWRAQRNNLINKN